MIGSRLRDNFDLPTSLVAFALTLFGLLAIASATAGEGGGGQWRQQAVWLVLGAIGAAIIVSVDYRTWAQLAVPLHLFAIALLVITLFFGREIAGNKSWLVFGPIRLQPSEIAKWTTCLALATYLASRVRERLTFRQLLDLILIAGVPMALVVLQPDHGTALLYLPILTTAVLLGGVRWRLLALVALLMVLAAPVGWQQLRPYQKERILTVFDAERDPRGIGYQSRQSRIAIGSGRLWGKGLGKGTQTRLHYLPAPHTDFVLAVIAEELGFLGIAAVLSLFYVLLLRGIQAARSAQDRLGNFLALLICAWFASQLAINIGMVLGKLPTIGVPLPLISYGGSAMITAAAGVGLIVNIRSRRFVN